MKSEPKLLDCVPIEGVDDDPFDEHVDSTLIHEHLLFLCKCIKDISSVFTKSYTKKTVQTFKNNFSDIKNILAEEMIGTRAFNLCLASLLKDVDLSETDKWTMGAIGQYMRQFDNIRGLDYDCTDKTIEELEETAKKAFAFATERWQDSVTFTIPDETSDQEGGIELKFTSFF